MFIRFLTGRDAGEIVEMKYVDAQVLIADGRAEKFVAGEPAVTVKQIAPTPSPAAAPAPTPKRKAKR